MSPGVPDSGAGSVGGRGSLWRNRDFMLLWCGQTFSGVGSEVTLLALPLTAAVVLGVSTFDVGLLRAVASLGQVLFALPAGVMVDRTRKLRTMLACDIVRAVTLGSIALGAFTHVLTFDQLLCAAAVNGVCDTFFGAAYRSFPAVLLGRERLLEANSKMITSASFASFVGPGLGGVLIATLGAARAIGADAISYAVNAVTLGLIRHREAETADTGGGGAARPRPGPGVVSPSPSESPARRVPGPARGPARWAGCPARGSVGWRAARGGCGARGTRRGPVCVSCCAIRRSAR